jgi:hypothetical protein
MNGLEVQMKKKTTRKTTSSKKPALRDLTTLESRAQRVKAGVRARRPKRI